MFKPKKSITKFMEFCRDCSDFLWLLPIFHLKFVIALGAGHFLCVFFAVTKESTLLFALDITKQGVGWA